MIIDAQKEAALNVTPPGRSWHSRVEGIYLSESLAPLVASGGQDERIRCLVVAHFGQAGRGVGGDMYAGEHFVGSALVGVAGGIRETEAKTIATARRGDRGGGNNGCAVAPRMATPRTITQGNRI